MNDITLAPQIASMSPSSIDNVRRLEEFILHQEQVQLQHEQTLHDGVYTRTVMIPAGVIMTGAMIVIPTTLIINGHCTIYVGGGSFELKGYQVITAAAGRKQVFIAHEETHVTMIFKTSAKTTSDAESEFTDEADRLMTRGGE